MACNALSMLCGVQKGERFIEGNNNNRLLNSKQNISQNKCKNCFPSISLETGISFYHCRTVTVDVTRTTAAWEGTTNRKSVQRPTN